MRGADLILARPLLKPEHLVGLFTRHADSPAARRPRLLLGSLLRPSFAPALRAPVEIGLDQGRTLSVRARAAPRAERGARLRSARTASSLRTGLSDSVPPSRRCHDRAPSRARRCAPLISAPATCGDANGPPEPNQDLTGSPSSARPKKARGMASGKAPRASRKAATRRSRMPPAMRMPTASFCGFADASSAGAENENEESRETGEEGWHCLKSATKVVREAAPRRRSWSPRRNLAAPCARRWRRRRPPPTARAAAGPSRRRNDNRRRA